VKRYRAIVLIPTYVDFSGPEDLKTAGLRAVNIVENMGGVAEHKSKLLYVQRLPDPPTDPLPMVG